MRSVLPLLLLTLCAPLAAAQRIRPGDSTISLDGRKISVWAPAAVRGRKPLPLLIALHGAGGRGSNYIRFIKQFLGARKWIVIAPTAAPGAGSTWQVGTAAWLGKLIDHVAGRAPIDRLRVYLNGHSAGCAFSFYVLGVLPKRFAAVAGTAGYYPPGCDETGLRKATATRIWFGVGRQDVNHAHLARGAAQLRALGLTVTTYAPNIGHTISAEEARRMLGWLDKQRLPGTKKQSAEDPPPTRPKKQKTNKPNKPKRTWLETEQLAADALARAEKLLAAGKLLAADAALASILSLYKGSEAASRAERLRKTPRLVKVRRGAEARRLYQLAENFRSSGSPEKARTHYRQLVAQYADTRWAKLARARLAD